MLALYTQALPACDNDGQIRATLQQLAQRGRCLYHLLKIVQHEQQMSVTQIGSQDFKNRTLAHLLLQSLSNGWYDQLWIMDRRQWNKTDAIGKIVLHIIGNGKREAGFSDPPRSGHRQQAHFWADKQDAGSFAFRLAPDE